MGIEIDKVNGPVGVDLNTQAFGNVVNFKRAANTTQYAANDVVGSTAGGAIELGILGIRGRDIIIQSTRLAPLLTAVPATPAAGNFRLALYSAPPAALADNAAWTIPVGDLGYFIDTVDLGTVTLPAASAQLVLAARDNIGKQIRLPSSGLGKLWGYLITDTGFTPAANSETYQLEVRTLVV